MHAIKYGFPDFQRDVQLVAQRLKGRQIDGVTSQACCCPKAWTTHLAMLLDVPMIDFNKRTGATVELRVQVEDYDVTSGHVFAIHASRAGQRYVMGFLRNLEYPLTISV